MSLIVISSHSQFDKNGMMASIQNGHCCPWNVKQDREKFITSQMIMEAGMLSHSFHYTPLVKTEKRFQQNFLTMDWRKREQKLAQYVYVATAMHTVRIWL